MNFVINLSGEEDATILFILERDARLEGNAK